MQGGTVRDEQSIYIGSFRRRVEVSDIVVGVGVGVVGVHDVWSCLMSDTGVGSLEA